MIQERYIVCKQIDCGGFGTIFDCQDSKTYRNDFVIKVVSATIRI